MGSRLRMHIPHHTKERGAVRFEEFEGTKVMMGNNSYCMVRGKGKITIKNEDESVVILSNVRYMPEMGRNLISY